MPSVGGVTFTVQVTTGNSRQALLRLQRAFQNFNGSVNVTQQKTKDAARSFKDLKGAISALGIAFVATRFAAVAKESVLLAARVENLDTVLDNVAQTAGLSLGQIDAIDASVQKLGITVRQSRQAITLLAQAELDLAKSSKLARIAQDAAVIAGINSSDAFERLVVAIQRNDSRLLRNLGIVVNLNQVYAKFGAETGRTAASLSAFEKRQILYNEVVEKGKIIQGTYEAALGDVFKRFTSMDRLVEEASRTFGEQFIPVMETAVDTTSRFLKFITTDSAAGFRVAAGTVGTFVAVLSSLTLGITLASAAWTAFMAVIGPVGLVALGISAAIAGVAAAFQYSSAQALEFEKRLKSIQDTASSGASQQVARIVSVEAVEDSIEALDGTAQSVDRLNRKLAEFAEVAGREKNQVLDIIDTEDLSEKIRLFETLINSAELALTVEEEVAKREEAAARTRRNLFNELARALEDVSDTSNDALREVRKVFDLKDLDSFIDGSGRLKNEFFELEGIFESLATQTDVFNADGTRITDNQRAGFIAAAQVLRDYTDSLRAFEEENIRVVAAAKSTRDSLDGIFSQEFIRRSREAEAQVSVISDIESKLQTIKNKDFRGTLVEILSDTGKALGQLSQSGFESIEQIVELGGRRIAQGLNRVNTDVDELLEQAKEKFKDSPIELDAALAEFARGDGTERDSQGKILEIGRVRAERRAALQREINDQIELQLETFKRREESVAAQAELADRRIDEISKEAARLQAAADQRDSGLDRRIREANVDFETKIAQARRVREEVNAEIKELEAALTRAEGKPLETEIINTRLELAKKGLRELSELEVALRRDTTSRISKIQRDALDTYVEDVKRRTETVGDSIAQIFTQVNSQAIRGSVESAFTQFRDLIRQAENSQLKTLNNLFEQRLTQLVKTAKDALEEARQSLEEFDDAKQDREFAINNRQRQRREDLIFSGTDEFLATQIAAEEADKERAKLQRERAKLVEGVNSAEQELLSIQERVAGLSTFVADETERRSSEIARQNRLLEEQLDISAEILETERNKALEGTPQDSATFGRTRQESRQLEDALRRSESGFSRGTARSIDRFRRENAPPLSDDELILSGRKFRQREGSTTERGGTSGITDPDQAARILGIIDRSGGTIGVNSAELNRLRELAETVGGARNHEGVLAAIEAQAERAKTAEEALADFREHSLLVANKLATEQKVYNDSFSKTGLSRI